LLAWTRVWRSGTSAGPERFGEILEAAISREQEHEAAQEERRRRAREERYWQKGLE
jgi:hypothetical protein